MRKEYKKNVASGEGSTGKQNLHRASLWIRETEKHTNWTRGRVTANHTKAEGRKRVDAKTNLLSKQEEAKSERMTC